MSKKEVPEPLPVLTRLMVGCDNNSAYGYGLQFGGLLGLAFGYADGYGCNTFRQSRVFQFPGVMRGGSKS